VQGKRTGERLEGEKKEPHSSVSTLREGKRRKTGGIWNDDGTRSLEKGEVSHTLAAGKLRGPNLVKNPVETTGGRKTKSPPSRLRYEESQNQDKKGKRVTGSDPMHGSGLDRT